MSLMDFCNICLKHGLAEAYNILKQRSYEEGMRNGIALHWLECKQKGANVKPSEMPERKK